MLCLDVMSSMQMQHWSTGPVPFPVCCGSIATSDGESPFLTGLPPAELSLVRACAATKLLQEEQGGRRHGAVKCWRAVLV